jgi:hypothetical protein
MRTRQSHSEPIENRLSTSDGRHPSGRGAYPFDANAPAWFQVVLDDKVIMSKSATTRGGDFKDGTTVDSFELGLSITSGPAEFYLDDVVIQDVTGPFTGPKRPFRKWLSGRNRCGSRRLLRPTWSRHVDPDHPSAA